MCGLILVSVTGCLSSTVPSDSFCLISEPIYADPDKDTVETMRQVDEHNAVGVELCDW